MDPRRFKDALSCLVTKSGLEPCPCSPWAFYPVSMSPILLHPNLDSAPHTAGLQVQAQV